MLTSFNPRNARVVVFWWLLLLLGGHDVVGRDISPTGEHDVGNSTLDGDDRIYFSSVIRRAKIVEKPVDPQTQLANVTVQFSTGPNPPNSEYYFKCVPSGQGCEAAAPNATVTGSLPKLGQVTATIVNLDFTPGLYYSCYVGVQVGKITTCEAVSSGPEGQFFYLGKNGVTIMCPDAEVGRTGYVNGIQYTKVDEQTLRSMANNLLAWNRLPFVCTSGITDMSYLFTNTPDPLSRQMTIGRFQSFNENIASWDTGSVQTMSFMFANANAFNQDVGWWDVSNVQSMDGMFLLANSFNQSISTWDTRAVITFKQMFLGASQFNSDISLWNTANAIDMSYMFDHASIFNSDLGAWDTSQARFMQYMFNYAFSFDQDIGGWNVSNVVDMNHMFAAATTFNRNLDSWETSRVENMNALFAYTDVFNGNVASWDVSQVKSMTQMFNFAPLFNQDISLWNVSKVVQFSWMFYGASSFNTYIGGWNTESATGMEGMFMDTIFNQDVSRWNVEKVAMCQSFAENGALNTTYYPRFNCVLGHCATGKTYQKHSPSILYSKMDEIMTSGNTASIVLQKTNIQNYCSAF